MCDDIVTCQKCPWNDPLIYLCFFSQLEFKDVPSLHTAITTGQGFYNWTTMGKWMNENFSQELETWLNTIFFLCGSEIQVGNNHRTNLIVGLFIFCSTTIVNSCNFYLTAIVGLVDFYLTTIVGLFDFYTRTLYTIVGSFDFCTTRLACHFKHVLSTK